MCGVCSFSSLQPLTLTDAHAVALFHLNYGNIVILHIEECLIRFDVLFKPSSDDRKCALRDVKLNCLASTCENI